MPSPTGPSPTAARLPSLFGRHAVLSLRPAAPATGRTLPRHPMRNPRRVSRAQGLAILRFRSPLLTECPFLQVLRCFTSLRTPAPKGAVTAHDGCRVTPFRNPRIKASSAAPRGISLPATSFIGPVCQGIHHTPLQATPHTGEPARPNEHRTTDHQHSAITKRSNNNQTPKTGTRSKYISTSRPQPATPKKGGHAVRSRPLSSSQTTTPHHTPPPGDNRTGTHGGHPNANPRQGGPWRPGNPTACPYPPPQQGRNDPSTPARPTPQGTNPGNHAKHSKHSP